MRLVLLLVVVSLSLALAKRNIVCDPQPGTPVNTPMGNAKGIHPGRVVWVHNKDCCSWDGKTGNWYDDKVVSQSVADAMLSESLRSLTGAPQDALAWSNLFRHFNRWRYAEDATYKKGEKIAIKINLNGEFSPDYKDVQSNGLSPQYLQSVVSSLVNVAGVAESDICVYDASRWFTPVYYDHVHSKFPQVRCVDNGGKLGREKVQVDPASFFHFSSAEVPGQDETKLPTCVTQARYVVEVDNVRGHSIAGITETGKNWFGSIYRPLNPNCTDAGFWCPRTVHAFVNVTGRTMGSYNVLVDLLGHKDLGGKVMLFLADGLMAGPDQLGGLPNHFLNTPFNDWWASSSFASQDPIALDSVLYDILHAETKAVPYASVGCVDNYLHEAALASNPPSKTVYNPNGTPGTRLQSLGVHEHWNNAQDKKYSRNLGKPEGIELVQVFH